MRIMKSLFCFMVVWVMLPSAMFSQTANKLTSKEKKDGLILLFDGMNSNGWTTTSGKPVPAGWEVNNGSITAKKGGKGGDIISVNEYSDFDLSLDYNIEPGCNSGIKYFFTKYENGGNLGMEYQIIDDKRGEDIHQENHLSGSFYDVLPPIESKKKINTPGQWNTLRVVAKGKKVEHWSNGVKILEFTRGSKVYTDAVALSKFNKTMPAFGMVEKGHILLQEHGGVVSFKNIKIKLL
jgi:Domain of Unknown Function (DUF1080)